MAEQNTVVEAYYGGAWNTLPVFERSPIRITSGLRNEAASPVPATCTMVLDGRSDSYNPYDPASVLYGVAGRNTPIRVGIDRVTDDFSRTESNGWGTSSSGAVWTTSGTASAFAVGSGVGTIASTITVRAAVAGNYGPSSTLTKFKISTRTGSPIVGVASAYVDTTHHLQARVFVTTTDLVQIAHADGATTVLASAALSSNLVADTWYWMRTLADSVLGVRVWADGDPEPTNWQASTPTTVSIVGPVGPFVDYASTATFDDLQIDSWRFHGEIASFKPGRSIIDPLQTPGKGDRWCEIEAAGVMRRLAGRNSPLRSALYRYLSEASEALAYWPLEDGADTSVAAEVRRGGGPGRLFSSPAFGTDSGALVGAQSVVSGGAITASVTASPTAWSVSFAVRIPETPGGTTSFGIVESVGDATDWYMDATATGFEFSVYDVTGVSPLDSTSSLWGTGAEPGTWLIMQINVTQNGSNVDWDVKWHPIGTSTFYWTGVRSFASTVSRASNVLVQNFEFGHIIVGAYGGVDITLLAQLAIGKAGELAEDRMERLCGEEGLTFTMIGDADSTPPMSGQTVKTLVDLQAEAASADQGILHELRFSLGFALRPLRSMYNQASKLDLDMSTEGIAPPLDPVVDDLPTENDVTAKRPHGSEARSVLETGRMSVLDPPDGVGRTAVQGDAAVYADQDLPGWAQWRLHLGTVDEARYPQVTVDLDATPSLAAPASAVSVGDVITVDHIDNQNVVRLIVLGYTEVIGTHRRLITFNCAPASPYNVGKLDDTTYGRIGSDGSTVNSSFVAGTGTSLSVAIASGYPLWETGSVNYEIDVDGAILTVSNISGASSPQTFTVSTTVVNGIAKTIAAGKPVRLAIRNHIGR